MEFAEQTRQAVLNRDYVFFADRYSDLDSFTIAPGTHAVDRDGIIVTGFSDHIVDWIYETDEDRRSVASILSSPDLNVLILPDWTPAGNAQPRVDLIVFYTGEEISEIDWVEDYMQRFCVTEVVWLDGQWRFIHTLFRSESGHPFAADYG